jgi:uncharacterized protein
VDIGVHQDGLVHVSAMSHNFVKDPRDVVKPGDIVKVKVLDVDVPRKRISLTLRLDDDPAAVRAASGPGSADRRAEGGRSGRDGRAGAAGRGGSGRGRPADGPVNTALADALRRAGLAK